ncbi:YtxH domain-containing protein [Staphylococcus pragensis]|uniref:YtxH domain-containing protein n=1 Tax=Staphylococcus pragensis TaxID=1611836 RepID=A0A4Z1BF03_9STAP|nr:EscU/YscU/HrcU family type III secretion system export apparatus switch protein [Staphylococcus pragensis]RTX89492.1 YtxH domain-containing protein [Staphylococcus carnosus]TGN23830.1 YtxH domain-containing protein [Staphylococcus pragensis]GGG96092.1 lytic transglycosylase [Staphylococcus pragensis]
MFNYHSLAFKNAKSQILKTILFSIVSFLIVFAIFVVARTFFIQSFMQMQIAAQFQQSTGSSLFIMILTLVLGLLFFILVGYQLLAGAFNVMAKAIKREKVSFSDLFFAFKKGKYSKSIVLALLSMVLYIIMYLITMGLNFLFNKALTPIFTSLQQSVSTSDHAIGILLTVQIIFVIIMGLILSLVYWFFFIWMINYTVSLSQNNDLSAMNHFKEGFKGIKNGNKTWLKFFIAIILINLVIIIITQPLGTLISVSTANMSQKAAQVIMIIAEVIILVLRFVLYFVILMGIVQYFLKRGEKQNKLRKNKKLDKNEKTKGTTNDDSLHKERQESTSVNDKLKNQSEVVTDKVKHHSDKK